MWCPILFNSNTFELTVHTSCYWVLTNSVLEHMSITVYVHYMKIINKTLESCIYNRGHLMPPTLKNYFLF